MKKYLFILFLLVATTVQAQTTQEMQHVTLGTVAGSTVADSYVTLVANASGNPFRTVDIANTSDCEIYVSFDASTHHYQVSAGSSLTLNYADLGRHITGAVSVQSPGDDCTSGTIFGSAGY